MLGQRVFCLYLLALCRSLDKYSILPTQIQAVWLEDNVYLLLTFSTGYEPGDIQEATNTIQALEAIAKPSRLMSISNTGIKLQGGKISDDGKEISKPLHRLKDCGDSTLEKNWYMKSQT